MRATGHGLTPEQEMLRIEHRKLKAAVKRAAKHGGTRLDIAITRLIEFERPKRLKLGEK